MFNPAAAVRVTPITGKHQCLVIDDALLKPEIWVEQAVAHRQHFEPAPQNAFPGVEFALPESLSGYLAEYFNRNVRERLGARRLLEHSARLAMVTLPVAQLLPRQWICHRDRAELLSGECMIASVLYLFEDASFGGTNFFQPRLPMAATNQLIEESGRLTGSAFRAAYGIEPGYQTASNAWFDQVASIPAKWNRLIFYDGGELFHCADIRHPDRVTDDPQTGRLAMNGFFRCRRAVR